MNTIITHPNFDYLGKIIAKEKNLNHANVKFDKFPDTWPNMFVDKVKDVIEHKEVTYIGDFSHPEELFRNYAIIRGLLDYYVDKLRIVMPYFPVGTMERIDTKGQIATAKYFADIMSHVPSGRLGKTSIHTFDIHALVERFLFDSHNVNVEMHTAMSLLRKFIEGKSIAFPDEGAYKRFGKEFNDFDTIICSKMRDGDKRIITVKEGDPKGKSIVMLDDLIQTGGTLKNTAGKLRELGASSVEAFATHGVFPNNSHISLASHLDSLIVTDTIPENIKRAKDVKNMKVLSISELIEKVV